MDQDNVVYLDGLYVWWLAGQCRHCQAALVFCQDCGIRVWIPKGRHYNCNCGYRWDSKDKGIKFKIGNDSIQ